MAPTFLFIVFIHVFGSVIESAVSSSSSDKVEGNCEISEHTTGSTTEYQCTIRWISIPRNVNLLINSFDNSNFTILRFDSVQCPDFPYTVFSQLAQLEEIEIEAAQISHIPFGSFILASHLISINMASNRLNEIGPDTFAGASNLQIIDLRNNSLQSIDKKAFSELAALSEIRLGSNRLESIHRDTFADLNNLEDLDLANNKLSYQLELHLSPRFLSYLDVSNNQLRGFTLAAAVEPRVDNKSKSRIRINPSIQLTIDATSNRLQEINVDVVFKAQELRLHKNQISTVKKVICFAEELYLDDNPIKELLGFKYPHNIKHLSLKRTNVSISSSKQFREMKSLISLDLSSNFLLKFSPVWLKNAVTLERLYLHSNQLTELDVDDLVKRLFNLTLISIARNNFTCHDIEAMEKYFKVHNVTVLDEYDDLEEIFSSIRSKPKCISETDNGILLHSENFGPTETPVQPIQSQKSNFWTTTFQVLWNFLLFIASLTTLTALSWFLYKYGCNKIVKCSKKT